MKSIHQVGEFLIGEFLGLVDPFAKDSTSGRLLGVFHPL